MVKRTSEREQKGSAVKKARLTVDAHEYQAVQTLDDTYRIPLYRADCFYVPDLIREDVAQRWHDELASLDTWYQPTLKVYGKEVTQSRSIAAYSTDPKLEVKYSGANVIMHHDYPAVLQEIQNLVEHRLGVKFNHVMLNRYENGSIYIGDHRDNLENRVIASVSVGAPRSFVLKYAPPKRAPPELPGESDGKLKAKQWVLANGSLVVMQGEMQQYWKHRIPRESKVKASRISLTFRQLCF